MLEKEITIALLITFGFLPVAGQIVNGSSIFIAENALFTADDHVINSGFIENHGELYISKDYQNSSIYQGPGTIVLYGANDQNISNNNQQLANLRVLNGSKKYLTGDIVINKDLELQDGIVVTDENHLLTLADRVNISGASAISYVDGPLAQVGPGYKFYPIGKNGAYRPVELVDINGIAPVICMEVIEGVPGINFPEAVDNVSVTRYWQQKTISGSFTGSPVTISFGDDDDLTDIETAVLLNASGLDKSFKMITKVTTDGELNAGTISTNENIAGGIYILANSLLKIHPLKAFYFPTTLSPTAINQENRRIRIFGNNIADDDFSFVVFNRWGLKVFETQSLDQMQEIGWNGINQENGKILPQGAYPYILKFKNKNNSLSVSKGVISIL